MKDVPRFTERVRDNSVCWNLTMRCNDRCSFCFIDLNSCKDSSFDQNKQIAERLVCKYGIRKITFTGGEALLYKDVFKLARFIKDNFEVKLSLVSNAILLDDAKLDKIMELFDYVSFSLDACSDEDEAEVGRNRGHFSRIISVLDMIDKKGQFNVKINSMVSSVNAPYIHKLYQQVISKYSFIDRWKIFRFAPLRGEAKKNGSIYGLTDAEWQKVVENINSSVGCSSRGLIEITGTDIDDYMIVDPDGTLKMSNFKEDKVIENLIRS